MVYLGTFTHLSTGLGFCHGKKYFRRDSGKKLVKTGNILTLFVLFLFCEIWYSYN